MNKILSLLIGLLAIWNTANAQTSVYIKGKIDNPVAGATVWINYNANWWLGCYKVDSTTTNSSGEFFYHLTGSCAAGTITVNMLGCLGMYDTLGLYDTYDSSRYGDTLEFNFKYCDTACRGFDAYFFSSVVQFSKTVNFSTFVGNGTPNKYSWDFGSGWMAGVANPSHAFPATGTYTVRLKAEDTVKGCVDSFQNYVQVPFYDSVFVKGQLDTAINNKIIHLYNKTLWYSYLTRTVYTNASGYYEGWAYVWDSTGTIVAGATSCYSGDSTYGQANYSWYRDTVIIDLEFCPDTLCHNFNADFYFNSYGYNKTVSFTGITTGNKFSWDFGDGNTSAVKSPVHTYANSGQSYNVKFVARDTVKNCIDSMSRYITINFYDSVYVKGQLDTPINGKIVTVMENTAWGPNWNSMRQATTNSLGQYGTWVYVTDSIGGVIAGIEDCRNDSSTNTGNYTQYRDTVIINLEYCPTPLSTIYGYVIPADSTHNFNQDTLMVWLIRRDTVAGDTLLTAVDSINNYCCGYFTFSNVPSGDYLVKAALKSSSSYYNDYLPTYYGNATQWRNAGLIVATGTNYYVPFIMTAGTNPGGPGFIGGLVSQGANKFGDPIEKVQVTLYTSTGVPVAYTYTNANGEYSFSNLAYGSYKVVVEIPGKPSEEYMVTLDANNESSTANNFEVNTKDIRKSGTTSVRKVTAAQLAMYPNPASTSLTVVFDGSAGETVSVVITDISGKTVLSETVEAAGGKNDISVDVANLQTGFYIVNLHAASGAYTGKLSINR